ncbi:hypothetical protein GCM10009714_08360 [Microlunatus capsulatus]
MTADLRVWLAEVSTDDVTIRAALTPTRSVWLRYDFIRTGPKGEIWLTAALRSEPPTFAGDSVSESWTLSPGDVLPLVHTSDRESPGSVLVWRYDEPRSAADQLQALLEAGVGLPVREVHLQRQECTPGELETRLGEQAAIRRLGSRNSSRGVAVTTCDRCHLPLSDPTSVRLGIGPECLKYYSVDVLAAARSRSTSIRRRSAVKSKRWLNVVRQWVEALGPN